MTALRVLPPTHYVGAVEAMDEIAAYVVRLLDAGAAYRVDDDVYFSVAAAEHFGAVSGYDTETMLRLSAERGGDPGRIGKKDPLDPLLWMAARPGEPAWDSPLGRGRPGWHVECSAIALNRLGAGFDVQAGGSDLVFPHHEMSAAHGEVGTGPWPFARVYVHAGMVGPRRREDEQVQGQPGLRQPAPGGRCRAWGTSAGAAVGALPDAIGSGPTPRSRRGRQRLAAWRAGVARPYGPAGEQVVDQLRAALAQDLDTAAALQVVDAWCALGRIRPVRVRRRSRPPSTRCWGSTCAEPDDRQGRMRPASAKLRSDASPASSSAHQPLSP